MAKEQFHLTPGLTRQMESFGQRLELARRRRKLTILQMSERIGVSRLTYSKMETGDPAVSLGNYVKALNTLGLLNDFNELAKEDEIGRQLQDAELTHTSTPSRGRKP